MVLAVPTNGYAEEPLGSDVLSAVETVYPKRPGYFHPVGAADGPDIPSVSLDVTADAQEAIDALPGMADAAADAVLDAASYTTYRAWTKLLVFNERGQLVYRDRTTFRFRRSTRTGAISAVTLVPEESNCTTVGALAAPVVRPVAETCWFELGIVSENRFSFVTGSRFASFVGPVKLTTHHAGDSFVTYRDGTYAFTSDLYCGDCVWPRCPGISALPPGWYPECSDHDVAPD